MIQLIARRIFQAPLRVARTKLYKFFPSRTSFTLAYFLAICLCKFLPRATWLALAKYQRANLNCIRLIGSRSKSRGSNAGVQARNVLISLHELCIWPNMFLHSHWLGFLNSIVRLFFIVVCRRYIHVSNTNVRNLKHSILLREGLDMLIQLLLCTDMSA
jgi:hypothetical protein